MARPLDKKEAILYGQFVNAAYAMFKRDRTQLCPEPQPGDIPGPYELVAWLHMSDYIFWWREKPKFYGFIARHRQQKHNFVLAIRGTEGWVEWLDDAMARLMRFRQVANGGSVERGFDKIYSTLRIVKRHVGAGVAPAAKVASAAATLPAPQVLQGSFADQLEQLADGLEDPAVMSLAKERRPRRSFVVTGHSLGSALATLFVMENKLEKNRFDITTVCTFASPRVGNTEFVNEFNQLPLTSWRIVNTQDIVPKLPLHLPLFDYQHVGTEFTFSSAGMVKGNPGCWHSMCTYLHWLDPNNLKVDDDCKQ